MAQQLKKRNNTSAPKKPPEKKYLCYCCGETKKRSDFYANNDPALSVKVTTVCKACAEKIARNWNPRTELFGDCTKASICDALQLLNKPYFEKTYESAYNEIHNPDKNSGRKLTNVWSAYISRISMPAYATMTWNDSDIYETFRGRAMSEVTQESRLIETDKNAEIHNTYLKNREDTIRMLGYDPFDKEIESDKPLLYSQFLSYMDGNEEQVEDAFRTSSVIGIVKGFAQSAKVDDMIAKCLANIGAEGRAGEVKSLLDSKQKLSSTLANLAEQNCLSLRYNKNTNKGQDTWTGKIKKFKNMSLREAEVNGFDIETARGMRQVMDMSNASILKQIRLDTDEYGEIIAEQRELIDKLTQNANSYQEISRILLRENLELKDLIADNKINIDSNLTDLDQLFSTFSIQEISDDEDANDDDDNYEYEDEEVNEDESIQED